MFRLSYKMKRVTPVLLICMNVSICASAMFYHEPSLILLDTGGTDNADFGFAMGYQDKSRNLIVGAPTMDYVGKVFSCNLNDTTHTSCTDYRINVASLAPYTRDSRASQGFHTGSNIMTTTDYIFTCAPLWTLELPPPKPFTSAVGTCFVIQDTDKITHYKGTMDVHFFNKTFYHMQNDTRNREIMGGVGWVNLIDEENDLLLIAKASLHQDFIFGSKTKAWDQYNTISLRTTYENDKIIMWLTEDVKSRLIYAVVAGKFFSDKTLYAFSIEIERMFGKIAFLEYDRKNNTLSLLESEEDGVIEHLLEVPNSMFGAALGAADLNYDGFAELLVGAPAQPDNDYVECGAVHIYLGGELEEVSKRKGLRLIGNKMYSRFGTTIATNDLDGDEIPEIVVSAPYEGNGVVYIFAGFEINKLLKDGSKYEWTHKIITDLKYTQTIKSKDIGVFKNFGFSLQFLSDLDNNGCEELAIGSPGSGKVALLKCLPKVKVTMSIEMIGNKIVTEKDMSFEVKVCANFEFQKTAENVVETLFITNQITDEATSGINLSDSHYSIKIESKDVPTVCKNCPRYCKNCHKECKICTKHSSKCNTIVVTLKDNDPQEYNFTTKAELKSDHILNNTEFDTSWVVAFENSVTYLLVSRQKCEGKECLPRLNLGLDRVGSMDKIVAGETPNKTVIARVQNAGGQSFHTCLKVYIEGGKKALIQGGYSDTYYLPTPFNRDQQDKIEIVVDTSTPVNVQKDLQVKVELYENCDRKLEEPNATDNVTIPYEFKTDNIVVSGIPHRLNALNIEVGHTMKDHQEYTITNGGSVLWKNIQVLLSLNRTKYILSVKVLEQAKNASCVDNDDEKFYNRTCLYDLKPFTTLKITTAILMMRLDTMGDEELNVTSKLMVYLNPTDTVYEQSLTTAIEFKKESLSNKKWLVTIIAIVVAVIILMSVVFVLYKIGFFKRKQKEELQVLRTSIRRRGSRRGTHISGQDEGDTVEYEGLEMDVDDDSPFDEIQITKTTETDTTKDSADKIKK